MLGSFLGLTADLTLFETLIRLGAAPGFANAASSAVGVTIAYLLVTKYAFETKRSRKSYLAFVAWYAASILFFSLVIQFTAEKTGWNPIISKLASIPFSFSANFAFSRVLFRKSAAERDHQYVDNDPAELLKGSPPREAPGSAPILRTEADSEDYPDSSGIRSGPPAV